MPLLHVVGIKFKAEAQMDAEKARQHFENDVRLKDRMPELVRSWSWGPNVSLRERPEVNGGMEYVVTVVLDDKAALDQYGPHPEHQKVKALQSSITEKIHVLDTYVSDAAQSSSRGEAAAAAAAAAAACAGAVLGFGLAAALFLQRRN